ncbi:MAG TPA: hypothetical protein VG675_06955 [Bryobacteraceae bacterium]|nr:hypothetical protein [Bryobacteraceae bacterium]
MVQQTTQVDGGKSVQIQKLLASRTFHNTEVLKRLLEYLSRQALTGECDGLKECIIGIEAFGKPADYDTRSDSSVRVHAGKLRQKLEEYYRTEGIGDNLIVSLPKGHFNLEFRTRQQPAESSARRWPLWIALFAAAGALVVLPVTLRHRLPAHWTPEMEEFWSPFLHSGRPIMVIVGAPLFAKTAHSFFRDPSLNDWASVSQSDAVRGVQHALGDRTIVPSFAYTGVGEAIGAFELARLLLPRGRDLTLQMDNSLSWDELTRSDLLFVGPPKSNPQTNELPFRQDFEIADSHVQNLKPRPGEPHTFEEVSRADGSGRERGHALITRFPGLHRAGEILILAGSSTEETRAAVDFVTRPEYVGPFVRYMHAHGGIPSAFQLVIRARFRSQTPIAIERVAFHELK